MIHGVTDRVRVLVSDLDDVLRLHPAPTDAERAAGLPAGEVGRVAFRGDLLRPALVGEVSDEQWRVGVVAALRAAHPGADVEPAVAAWWRPGVVDPDVLALLSRARRRVPLVLLTNATTRLDADLAALGLDGAFDAVVNTSRVGVAKPAPGAFRAAHEAAAALVGSTVGGRAAGGDGDSSPLVPGELLLVDDRQANVDAVLALGWRAHRYIDPAGLQRRLAAEGLL